MESKTEIGKAIKDKLIHLDEAPRDFVWSKIEDDLNKKRRRRFLIWFIPSILLMGVLSTIGVIYNQNKNEITGTQKTPIHLLQDKTAQQSTGPKKKDRKKRI